MIVPPEGLILNVDKPKGITSFDVVRQIRRRLGVKKVGHGGTLDPMAEGVLLILVGRATKRASELIGLDKEYRAGILLGTTTDTYDITGKIVERGDYSSISCMEVERALNKFTGEIQQVPPMYSAVKIGGRKLYQLARRGETIERSPRKIKIHLINFLSWNSPVVTLDIHCSKGTYIRSLAYDLGRELGCGACLESLQRTAVGDYTIEDSLKLDEINLG